MKRYLIFAAIVPFIGGLLLLFVTTYQSGYWHETSAAEVGKFFLGFIKTLQYAYLFGIVPALMIASIDDILFHVRRIGWVLRMLIVGAVAFIVASLLYSSRGPDSGVVQFFLYGLVGLVPGILSSWLNHMYGDERPVVKA
jgi:uncharacterized membrane protein YeaQ/YmgE (transglycosylase-associated protein family)